MTKEHEGLSEMRNERDRLRLALEWMITYLPRPCPKGYNDKCIACVASGLPARAKEKDCWLQYFMEAYE